MNLMPLAVSLLVLGMGEACFGTVIAQWTFNSATTTAAVGIGSASGLGGVHERFFSGSPSDLGINNLGWSTDAYPPQYTGNKSAGVEFVVSTKGYKNIAIVWAQRVSLTASRYSRLQYTTNGTFFEDFPIAIMINAAEEFEMEYCDLTAYAGIADNPNFAFRIVTEFESTAAGTAFDGYVTASNSSYTTVGTVRFDVVTMVGDALPPLDLTPVLSEAGLSTNGAFVFGLSGASGWNYVVEATEDPIAGNWAAVKTNAAPFIFSESVLAPRRFYRAMVLK
jgi:hypothetical protein